MRLSALLDTMPARDADPVVTGLAIDHRKVAPGTIFGAFVGERFNGEDFIPAAVGAGAIAVVARPEAKVARSEEHTSELQSLMRISYAVFCLKKTPLPDTNDETCHIQ